MISNEIYKKDKAVIKEVLSAAANKIGIGYSIFGLVFSLIYLILDIYNGSEFKYTCMAMALMGFITMIGMILSLNGSTVYTGEKNTAQARTMVKGAYNQLPTFLCMPVRKESLYRYQFERLMFFVICPCIYSVILAIISLINNAVITVDIILCVGLVLLMTLSIFIMTYAVVFTSKSVKKFLNVFYMTAIILMSAGNGIIMFVNILVEEFGKPMLFIGIEAPNGEVFLLAMAVVFPVTVYLLYKNVILKRMGGGWYE